MDIRDYLWKLATQPTIAPSSVYANACRDGAEEISLLRAQLADAVREREDWKGKHQEACIEITRLRSELDQARGAISNSQHLFSLIQYIGSETPGIISLDWKNEKLTKLIADQIAENRSTFASTERHPTASCACWMTGRTCPVCAVASPDGQRGQP